MHRKDPQGNTQHPRRGNAWEHSQEFCEGILSKLWLLLHNLTHEEDNVDSRGTCFDYIIRQHLQNLICNLWVAHHAMVNCSHQALAVLLVCSFVQLGLLLGADNLLFHELHCFVNVLGPDKIHTKLQNFAANVQIGGTEGAQEVHKHFCEDVRVPFLDVFQPIQNNQSHVVVSVAAEELHKSAGGFTDGSGRGRETQQRACALEED
mmetsp:Transcript_198/g.521  ORF Transcript_198/g.521 Transcript_198/m.521 type:complete len:206 (+) Transcript_198:2564-3181(+)